MTSIQTTNLIAYYNGFDEGSTNSTWKNIAPATNTKYHFTTYPGVTRNNTYGYYSLTNNNAKMVFDVPSGERGFDTGVWTYEMWIRTRPENTTGLKTVLSTPNGDFLQITEEHLRLRSKRNGTSLYHTVGAFRGATITNIFDGKWHHVSITYGYNLTGGTATLRVDGRQFSGTGSNNTPSIFTDSTHVILGLNNPSSGSVVKADIGVLRIYKHASNTPINATQLNAHIELERRIWEDTEPDTPDNTPENPTPSQPGDDSGNPGSGEGGEGGGGYNPGNPGEGGGTDPGETPTEAPTGSPTDSPTEGPTDTPTDSPTDNPTDTPTDSPTDVPTDVPTEEPPIGGGGGRPPKFLRKETIVLGFNIK